MILLEFLCEHWLFSIFLAIFLIVVIEMTLKAFLIAIAMRSLAKIGDEKHLRELINEENLNNDK